jgi:hypothetical protein
MARPVEGGTRNDAGQGGAGDLAGRVERLETRQRALIRALARISGFTSSEMERLAAD